jgi:hypothetical protein
MSDYDAVDPYICIMNYLHNHIFFYTLSGVTGPIALMGLFYSFFYFYSEYFFAF